MQRKDPTNLPKIKASLPEQESCKVITSKRFRVFVYSTYILTSAGANLLIPVTGTCCLRASGCLSNLKYSIILPVKCQVLFLIFRKFRNFFVFRPLNSLYTPGRTVRKPFQPRLIRRDPVKSPQKHVLPLSPPP